MHHPARHRLARDERLLDRRDARDRDGDLDLVGAFLVLLALGLVALERIAAQPRAEREVGDPIRLHPAARQIGDDGRLPRGGRNFAHRDAAELHEVLGLEVARLAHPHNDQTRHVEAGRRHQVERRSVLALESVGGRRPRDQVAGGIERLASGGPEFQPLLAEQDENALCGRRKRGKIELQDAGHGADPLERYWRARDGRLEGLRH